MGFLRTFWFQGWDWEYGSEVVVGGLVLKWECDGRRRKRGGLLQIRTAGERAADADAAESTNSVDDSVKVLPLA